MAKSPYEIFASLTFIIPMFLALVAWAWTIVLAFWHKDHGMAILSLLIPVWIFVYIIMHPVRCRVPLAAMICAGLLLTLGLNLP